MFSFFLVSSVNLLVLKICDEIVFKLVCPLKIPNNNIDRLGNIMNNTNNLTCMKLGW